MLHKPSLVLSLTLATTAVSAEDVNSESTPEQKPTPEQNDGHIYLFTNDHPFRLGKIYGTGGLSGAFTFKSMFDCLDGAVEAQKMNKYQIKGICTTLRRNSSNNPKDNWPLQCSTYGDIITCGFTLKK